MNHTSKHPAELETALANIGLADLLDDYIARARVGVRFLEIERAAAKFGYEFRREHGNIYGRLWLVPTTTTPTPVMRLVTRSDVAAVHGGRRQRAL